MSIIREFTLYLHAGITTPEVIHANQYSQGETWIFKLLQDDGSVYVPSTGALIGVKADGHAIAGLTGTVLGDGRVSITTTQQLTAAAGDAICELTIDGGSNGSANFVIRVEKKPTDDAILSESDLSIIQEGLNSVTPAAIEEKVSDWLEENFTEPPVDPTLSISNAAADAKVTGDKLTELKTAIDLYAGNYTPSEITAVVSDVSDIKLTWEQGAIVNGQEQDNSQGSRTKGYINVFEWSSLKINNTAFDPTFYIHEYDENKTFIQRTSHTMGTFSPTSDSCKYVRVSTYSTTITPDHQGDTIKAFYENADSVSKISDDLYNETENRNLITKDLNGVTVIFVNSAYPIGVATNNDGNTQYIFKDIEVSSLESDAIISIRCDDIINAINTSPLTIYQYDINNTQISNLTYTKAAIIAGLNIKPLANAVSMKIRLYPSTNFGLVDENAIYKDILIYSATLPTDVDYISGICAPCAIGDSLTIGLSPSNVSGVSSITDVRWSWATQLFKKENGTDVNIIAKSGATARTILNEFATELAQMTAQDVVCVYLGTNQDYNGNNPFPIGTVSDIVTSWDDTPTDTFIGWYSKLLKTISHYNSQYSFNVCFGLANNGASERNDAIKLVCENVQGWYYQPTVKYINLLGYLSDNTDGTHFTPLGYAAYKTVFKKALNEAILNNPTAVNKTANVFR